MFCKNNVFRWIKQEINNVATFAKQNSLSIYEFKKTNHIIYKRIEQNFWNLCFSKKQIDRVLFKKINIDWDKLYYNKQKVVDYIYDFKILINVHAKWQAQKS